MVEYHSEVTNTIDGERKHVGRKVPPEVARLELGLHVGRLWARRALTLTLSFIPMVAEALTVMLVAWGVRVLRLE